MKEFKTSKGTSIQIMQVKGKDYMMVQQRLIWFREDHPLWSIETEFKLLTDKETIAKAVIRNEAGIIIATAHKRETMGGFSDHTEKAETGAIGRALLLCGYGTAFAEADLDEGERLADSPIESSEKKTQPSRGHPSKSQVTGASPNKPPISDDTMITWGKYALKGPIKLGDARKLGGFYKWLDWILDQPEKAGDNRFRSQASAWKDYLLQSNGHSNQVPF